MKAIYFRHLSIILILLTLVLGTNSAQISSTSITKKSNTDQKKAVADYKVTFIELGSDNCVPCKQMQPIMKSIEEKYGAQVKVIFYDVWNAVGKPMADKYIVRLIPTQVFLDENGVEFFRHEVFFPEDELIKVLNTKGVI